MKRMIFLAFGLTLIAQEIPLVPLSAGVEGAIAFNSSLKSLRARLSEAFEKAGAIAAQGGADEEYRDLLTQVKALKEEIRSLEERWRATSVQEILAEDEPYALWDVGETTLGQLIMEYGASDHLYIIPQELSSMKISLFSSIPLPRESWSEMIEMILAQNGVGVKKLNPFVKQLYILKLDPSAIQGIVDREADLQLFPSYARLFFVFSPPPEQLKSVQSFFERFSDPKQTTVQSIGSKVALVSTKDTIEKLIGLYYAVWEKGKGKIARIFNPTKIPSAEAEKVLRAVFSDTSGKGRPSYYPTAADELSILSLPQGLVLIGETETVERGQRILEDLESQLEDPGEKVIYWYSCKHSNPEDVAEVLEKVYDSLIGSNFDKRGEAAPAACPPPPPPPPAAEPGQLPGPIYPPANQPFNPVLPATAPFIQPSVIGKSQKSDFGNFIVDTKTTAILMVVRREELAKIKSLLKKLDVPKRMVQLDVMLVEKRLTDRKQVGINLLQLGTSASDTTKNALTFNNELTSPHKGILSFMFSRTGGDHGPAFDLTYNFLMAQEDFRVNANPSVLAINQTPAMIAIVDEISIENGAIPVQLAAGGVTFEKSFTRSQYGITIKLTPTIHLTDDGDELSGSISLETNLEFDTPPIVSLNDRPPINRRHIENQVCVGDGETVILGGLRRKMEEDTREKIPFLGDLPGIGKLFGLTRIHDTNTEMFVFITPRIIRSPVDDLRKIRQSEYMLRAGDIPEFLAKIDAAKTAQRKHLFDNSLKMLFDMY